MCCCYVIKLSLQSAKVSPRPEFPPKLQTKKKKRVRFSDMVTEGGDQQELMDSEFVLPVLSDHEREALFVFDISSPTTLPANAVDAAKSIQVGIKDSSGVSIAVCLF